MLDFVLARVRKEPHLGSLLTFVSDCDAPVSPAVLQTPGPFVTIPAFFFSSSPRNNYFARFPQARCPCAKVLFWGLREGAFPGCLRAFRVALVPRRFAWDGAISAFSLPYLVILNALSLPCALH
jgi:hypothetical protein